MLRSNRRRIQRFALSGSHTGRKERQDMNSTNLVNTLILVEQTTNQHNHPQYEILNPHLYPERISYCWYCGVPLFAMAGIGVRTPEGWTTSVEVPHGYKRWVRDHQFPKSRGGIDNGNIVPACDSCNGSKGKKTVEEYREKVSLAGADKPLRQTTGVLKYLITKYVMPAAATTALQTALAEVEQELANLPRNEIVFFGERPEERHRYAV